MKSDEEHPGQRHETLTTASLVRARSDNGLPRTCRTFLETLAGSIGGKLADRHVVNQARKPSRLSSGRTKIMQDRLQREE